MFQRQQAIILLEEPFVYWTGMDRRDAQEGRPGNLGSREGTDPYVGRCPTPPFPEARGGLKHHTVIS